MLAPLRPRPRHADAEEIALQAFAYVAWRPEERSDFLFETGLTASTIREASHTPVFLAGVLDYVVSDQQRLRRIADGLRTSTRAIDFARRELLPSIAVARATDPDDFGPGPLESRCEHCGETGRLDRRSWPHLPGRVATVLTPRCGDCGGGFDQGETWLDAQDNEVDQ